MTPTPLDLKRAQRADRIIRSTLAGRGLPVPSATPLLTHDEQLGGVLFWRMETEQLNRLEAYTSRAVLHQIATNLRGWPVVVCNHVGLAYGVVLSGQKVECLSAQISFPAVQPDAFLFGVDGRGQAASVNVTELGHMLVAGATGSGKSTFLRLLVHQALAHGFQLALADLDGRTFPMLAGHLALLQPLANTADEAAQLVDWLASWVEERRQLFARASGFPESLEEYNAGATDKLPRALVVLDEVSATLTAWGGPRSTSARALATLGWRARKFGLTLVLAGQDFRKDVVGAIKESLVGPTFAFRLTTAEAARNVGLPGAERLQHPGRALTDRWGAVQTYWLPKTQLITTPTSSTLTEREQVVASQLMEQHAGRMSVETLGALGLREREARRLCAAWDARGWTAKDPARANGRYLQPALLVLLRPNRPGRPNDPKPSKLA